MKHDFRINILRVLAFFPLAAFYLHGQSSAETGNRNGKYEGQTLCDAGDDVETSCTTNTGKNLSVCGTRKRVPYVMYMVYGTPSNISVASPRSGKFPLKYIYTETNESIYFFNINKKQYISYILFDNSDPENELKSKGLVVRNEYNHKIIDYDFCVKDIKHKDNKSEGISRIINYGSKAGAEEPHIAGVSSFVDDELEDKMRSNLYPDE